jgi:hypothetical protein
MRPEYPPNDKGLSHWLRARLADLVHIQQIDPHIAAARQ